MKLDQTIESLCVELILKRFLFKLWSEENVQNYVGNHEKSKSV